MYDVNREIQRWESRLEALQRAADFRKSQGDIAGSAESLTDVKIVARHIERLTELLYEQEGR